MSDLPPSSPFPPIGPAPGWWQASDGNWYPPDQQPGLAPPGAGFGAPGAMPAAGYGYGYPYGAPPARTNGLAIASLILGCAQFVFWFLATLPAIICGHIALSQIKRNGEAGRGMAIAGLVLGYLGLFAFLAFLAIVLVAVLGRDADSQFEQIESELIVPVLAR